PWDTHLLKKSSYCTFITGLDSSTTNSLVFKTIRKSRTDLVCDAVGTALFRIKTSYESYDKFRKERPSSGYKPVMRATASLEKCYTMQPVKIPSTGLGPFFLENEDGGYVFG
ncbi:hypothetical protein PIB30_092468, partial [Stylosanthes scabra]|nr:hypothetical protein [Stylosanthes scabra]